MDSNRLVGTLPRKVGRLKKLVELRLNGNGLTGTVPASLGGLPFAKQISLHDNDIVGTIPEKMCTKEWTNLTFDCGGNAPEFICPCCTKCYP